MTNSTVAITFVDSGHSCRGVSIKLMLFACTGLLSILLVAGFGRNAIDAWQRYQAARQMQIFDKGANRFVSGLFEVLMERLYTNNGLQAEAPADSKLLDDIDVSRKAVGANFKPGLAILQSFDFPAKPDLVSALDAALSNADRLRAGADTALKLPRQQRDADLLKAFMPGITGSVNAALKLWFSALHRAAQEDPVLDRLATIKEIGWQMRDSSGRERSAVSQAIASAKPVPLNLLIDNASLRARVDVLWQELEHLTGDPATHPEIRRAMAAAKEQYFGAFLRLDDDLQARGASGGDYGITAADYVGKTTPYIGSLLNVLHAAGVASEAYTQDLASRERLTAIIASSIAFFGVVLAVATLAIVSRRVTTPLKTMTAVMQALAANDIAVQVPARDRSDEIGAMARSVQVFKDNMIEASRLRVEQEALKISPSRSAVRA